MAFIYAMSDMHGDMEAFERALSAVDLKKPDNLLIFCGDYMAPPDDDFTMIYEIMRLQETHPNQVIAIAGNHEFRLVEEHQFTALEEDPAFAWMRKLPLFYETDTQIFVHAGVDEEAEDLWKYGCEDAYFCEKYPWSTGKFLKDIIAGHIGTWSIAGDPKFHDVYWDGESHYYLDGSVHVSHNIPVLKYDIERKRYTAFTFDDEGRPWEYELEEPASMDKVEASDDRDYW